MRIAVDWRATQYGRVGVAVYTAHLVETLARLFPEVELHLIGLPDATPPEPWMNQANVFVHPIAAGYDDYRRRDVWDQFQLGPYLTRLGADVYHATNYVSPVVRAPRCPVVVTLHDAYAFTPGPHHPELATRRVRWLVRAGARKARRLIYDSTFSQSEFETILGHQVAAKGTVIHLGPPPLPSDEAPTSSPDETVPFDTLGRAYAVAIGSDHPRKNYRRLVEAFSQPVLASMDLVIVGKRRPGSDLRLYAESLGIGQRVHITGGIATAELARTIRGARVAVMPSLYEGSALPIFEALQSGVPICAADNSCFPEHAGEAATYFNPLSVKDMARAIFELSSDESVRQSLIEQGPRTLARFSWARCAREHMDIYRAAIEDR